MGFKNKDEMLDNFFDHIFPPDGDEPTDEDRSWFEEMTKWFDQFDGDDSGGTEDNKSTNSPRRRRTTTTQPPRRRPRTNTASRSDDSSYGNKTFFGGK